jgi:hypothetical protein
MFHLRKSPAAIARIAPGLHRAVLRARQFFLRSSPGFLGGRLAPLASRQNLSRRSPINRRSHRNLHIEAIMIKIHKGAKHHERAAEHHELAAFHHREAAKHYRNDDHAHAAHQALAAHARLEQATHQANEAGRYHALRHGPTLSPTRLSKRAVRIAEHRPGILMPTGQS